MKLEINHQIHEFIPLQTFRSQWNLPDDFGLAYFEPKDWEVGRLDSSHNLWGDIKEQIVRAVPEKLDLNNLLQQPQQLADLFRVYLEQANIEMGLTEDQLDFAVNGLHDMLLEVVYTLVRLYQTNNQDFSAVRNHFDFSAWYQQWLNNSAQVFTKSYAYKHKNLDLTINVVTFIYGRVGMQIEIEQDTYYVLDRALTCPAWHFMGTLGQALSEVLSEAFYDS